LGHHCTCSALVAQLRTPLSRGGAFALQESQRARSYTRDRGAARRPNCSSTPPPASSTLPTAAHPVITTRCRSSCGADSRASSRFASNPASSSPPISRVTSAGRTGSVPTQLGLSRCR